ncbi:MULTISPECIES: energy-coupling factor ABC transporter ATP-binding protein [Halococcus]|uniref:Cobalt ABC transporter ATP-binding protein n=1 Tax=Halococcus salifodinae DSM 8989 TaxID=1227456 RepID=M0NGZ1_9EURY|nr:MULTISPECIES: ABC transporter ATP-binding protein [Halococcus]EMA55925.1 cobalt ABC transporter ATP-binding protein [Halococcus salifodinae DSM 8989]
MTETIDSEPLERSTGTDDEPLVSLWCESHTYPDGTIGMHDVEFAVHADEVVALVGANGSGKSTLLEHLNATLTPDEGELRVTGRRITGNDTAHARREVGFVFQDADSQLVAPTVLDDVMFGLQNNGLPADDAKKRAREALATVDAGHLEGRIPHYLSGGEKRLVGLAGVLVLEPSVVVLDEPFAGLDPERSRLVVERIRRIHAEGISVVLSTHDLDIAAEIADRICVMSEGNVIDNRSPREVFYDEDLLTEANLHPPSTVRITRDAGLDIGSQPVTEAELVTFLDQQSATTDGSGLAHPDGDTSD